MVVYRCRHCGFRSGSRREIREHIRKVHKIKGGSNHRSGRYGGSPITSSMERIL
ncbi:MAG TPA: hypothetical protein ENG61_02100 [Candidatus Korarchaeota archaeon]|nr:hypothetical protein [Candidatus Korarchaeota archaeon]